MGGSRREFLRAGLGALWAGSSRMAATAATAGKAGTLFIFATEFVGMQGTFAIDPEDGTWRRVTEAGNPTARVSPDGRTLAYVVVRGRGKGIWLQDTAGADEPRHVIDL